jgi:hypothetical protein
LIIGFLRFLAYTLMFIFIYRVIVGAFRYIAGDQRKPPISAPDPPREPKKAEPPVYQDVKDAKFRDVREDSTKPS